MAEIEADSAASVNSARARSARRHPLQSAAQLMGCRRRAGFSPRREVRLVVPTGPADSHVGRQHRDQRVAVADRSDRVVGDLRLHRGSLTRRRLLPPAGRYGVDVRTGGCAQSYHWHLLSAVVNQ